jgi:hypothetical protein
MLVKRRIMMETVVTGEQKPPFYQWFFAGVQKTTTERKAHGWEIWQIRGCKTESPDSQEPETILLVRHPLAQQILGKEKA